MPQLVLAYKNFAANANISHIGLGVSALNTAKVLKRHGIMVTAMAINSIVDLDNFLIKHPGVTHVVISAAWLPVLDLGKLVIRYPQIEFAVNIHSNVGFLQADSQGVALLRQYIHLQREILNFRVSGNDQEFVDWLTEVYTIEGDFLPNLYNLDSTVMVNKPLYNGGTLRIGAFGAMRPQKNFMTAAGAAIAISKELRVPVEFWMNTGRPDGGDAIARAIRQLFQGQHGVRLMNFNWSPWPQFLEFIETLHLMMQISYTESFNMVTCDGIARGVPSVVSAAIDWAPKHWVAEFDDALDVARTGRSLITDPHAVVDGVLAVERHNQNGFLDWMEFLGMSGLGFTSATTTRALRR